MQIQQTVAQSAYEGQTVLKTKRLVLRAPREGDAEAFVRLLNDIEMVRYTEFLPHPYTLADARNFIAAQRQPNAHGIQDALVACLDDAEGEMIGCTGYRGSAPPDMEIGYWVGRAYWGKGFAREIAAAALDHAFDTFGAKRITADAVAANTASIRVLKSLGFTDEGASVCATRMHGDQPARRHSHTAESWLAVRRNLAWGQTS